jgi:hypothetical protein
MFQQTWARQSMPSQAMLHNSLWCVAFCYNPAAQGGFGGDGGNCPSIGPDLFIAPPAFRSIAGRDGPGVSMGAASVA